MPNSIIDHLLVVDVDRTIVDTTALVPLWYFALRDSGLEPSIIDAVQHEIANSAGSFDVYSYMKQQYPDHVEKVADLVAEHMARLLEAAPPDNCNLFMPNAQKFLTSLVDNPVLFMTSGGIKWQEMKLNLISQSQVEYADIAMKNWHSVITQRSDKGAMLASVYDRGVFRLSALPDVVHDFGEKDVSAKQLALIDDKLISFVGLPQDVLAYHFLATGYEPTERQTRVPLADEPKLPTGIYELHDLLDFPMDRFYRSAENNTVS